MQGVKLLQWKFKGKSDMQILHEYSPSFFISFMLNGNGYPRGIHKSWSSSALWKSSP